MPGWNDTGAARDHDAQKYLCPGCADELSDEPEVEAIDPHEELGELIAEGDLEPGGRLHCDECGEVLAG
jgi:hypothetical protein